MSHPPCYIMNQGNEASSFTTLLKIALKYSHPIPNFVIGCVDAVAELLEPRGKLLSIVILCFSQILLLSTLSAYQKSFNLTRLPIFLVAGIQRF